MKRIIKYLIIISISILIILLSINLYVKYSTTSSIKNSIDDIDYILVLGASVKKDKISPMLKDRLDKAIEVYNDTKAKLILSGDSIKSDEYDEVGKMKKYMLDNNLR